MLLLLAAVCLAGPLHAQTSATRKSPSPPSEAALETFQQANEALRANHVDDAIAGFQRVTQAAPRFAEGYLNLGLALTSVSRHEEAVTALERAIALKPALRGAHFFLAIADYKLNRLDPASAAIRKETTLNPSDAQAAMWQGIIDLALGHLTLAVEDLDHASTLDPTNVDILYHRGRAALALSRESYEAMFKLDPHSWHVHQIIAEADSEAGHDLDAVEQYKLAIATATPQSGLYEALGSSLWRTGKYQEAAEAYETALKIDPKDTLTMYKLGCLRVDRSDAAGGKPLLERVATLDPTLSMTTYYLGRAESQLGNDRAAIADFERTIKDHLDDETTRQTYFQLSRAYRRVHDNAASERAQAQYRLLDQKTRDSMQEKLSRQRTRADRDTSIPLASEPSGTPNDPDESTPAKP